MGWLRFWRRGVRPQAYQRGVMRRYQREEAGWRAHLDATRGAVLRYARQTGWGELSVLGSGWLLDVPVDALVARGVELHLYDAAHPPQVVARYGGRADIHFHMLDVTGGLLDSLLRRVGRRASVLAGVRQLCPPVGAVPRGRAVVSLNLLSQLGYPLLESGWLGLADGEFFELVAGLQRAHLDWLGQFRTALVVSDVREHHYGLRDGVHLGSVPTVLVDLPALAERSTWRWAFDMSGAYLPDRAVELEVECGRLV